MHKREVYGQSVAEVRAELRQALPDAPTSNMLEVRVSKEPEQWKAAETLEELTGSGIVVRFAPRK